MAPQMAAMPTKQECLKMGNLLEKHKFWRFKCQSINFYGNEKNLEYPKHFV